MTDYTLANFLDDGQTPLPPVLPEPRVFVVRRDDASSAAIEEIFVTAHFAEYGQGGVLILMAYAIDAILGKPVVRTVRAFRHWLDVEMVMLPVANTRAN